MLILKIGENLSSDQLSNDDFIATHSFRSLIDTGATNTAISNQVSEKVGLISKGKKDMNTATKVESVNIYQVSVLIPITEHQQLIKKGKIEVIRNMHIKSHDLEVAELRNATKDFDVLLGMDIITQGLLIVNAQSFAFSF